MANKDEQKKNEVETNEQKKTDIIKIPVAKRHKILNDIAEQIDHCSEISDVFMIAGHNYKLQTLSTDEEVWADGYTNTSSPISTFTSIRVPKLAAAIREIDGVTISDLFDFPENANKADIEYHTSSQYRKRYWEMNQMLIWLGDRPDTIIKELWTNYYSLLERRDKSWDELKKSSARTPGGNLKGTSSQEKVSL